MVKVAITTQGCSHNYSDSEHMAGLLKQAGHELVDEDNAEVVLFNTCTVKTPTENTFLRTLNQIKKLNKKIVIGGCIPQAEPTRFTNYSLIGTRQLDSVVEIVEKTAHGERVQLLTRNALPMLSAPKVRRNPLIETIPISIGCLSACSFCKTKHARGALESYPVDTIVNKVREVTNECVKEIWLTSEDTGCYGFDKGANAAHLLKEICKIKKYFKIRFGMGNPDHIVQIKEELIDAYRDEKVYKFLHIPVQSGNNGILRQMKRNYTVEQFQEIVAAFRQAFPRIVIATDVICGFPGETEEQFMDTIQLLEEVKPDVMNISRFWARQGTAAAQMEQLHSGEIKKRSRMLTDVCERISLEKNKQWIGWKGTVFINEQGKNNTLVGRNFAYKPVVVRGNYKLGEALEFEIVDAGEWDLKGVSPRT